MKEPTVFERKTAVKLPDLFKGMIRLSLLQTGPVVEWIFFRLFIEKETHSPAGHGAILRNFHGSLTLAHLSVAIF